LKAFIDTSTLIKKYIIEKGSDEFDVFLDSVSEIIVSPIYQLEVAAAIDRRLREKTLSRQQARWIQGEVAMDCGFFSKVLWNENLERKAQELIEKHHLKMLDSLQLASGCLSKAGVFVTSDKKLFVSAKKEMKNTRFI